MTRLNPYTATEDQANTIVDVAHRLPEPRHEDFFSALTVDDLQASTDYVLSVRGRLRAEPLDLGPLAALRDAVQGAAGASGVSSPWDAGYQAAMALRRVAGIGNQTLRDDDAIAGAHGMEHLPFVSAERPPKNWGCTAKSSAANWPTTASWMPPRCDHRAGVC